jgi:hypothetical protein
LTNNQSVIADEATVSVQFFQKSSTVPIGEDKQKYYWLNPGETRFFRLQTGRKYSTDFRITVDWVPWPAAKKLTVDSKDVTRVPRILELKDVRFDRCGPAPASPKLCFFRVVVTGGGNGNVDIGLFDSSGKLIDVILTQNGAAWDGRHWYSEALGKWKVDTTIGTGSSNTKEGIPGVWELGLDTNQAVDSMVSWKGGPW